MNEPSPIKTPNQIRAAKRCREFILAFAAGAAGFVGYGAKYWFGVHRQMDAIFAVAGLVLGALGAIGYLRERKLR